MALIDGLGNFIGKATTLLTNFIDKAIEIAMFWKYTTTYTTIAIIVCAGLILYVWQVLRQMEAQLKRRKRI